MSPYTFLIAPLAMTAINASKRNYKTSQNIETERENFIHNYCLQGKCSQKYSWEKRNVIIANGQCVGCPFI